MRIIKKRVNNTAIVVIDDKMYTRTNVDDGVWIEILEQIDIVLNSPVETISIEIDKLYDLIDMERIAAREALRKSIDEMIAEGMMYDTKEERIRNAVRIADISGIFEYDEEGLVYLKGFNHVMPKIMVDAILDAHYNPNSRYTVNSLLNFWKYLLLNPDKHVRTGLFKWINSSKFSITEDGNIISYRNVDIKKEATNSKLQDFITESFNKIKRWKKSPKNYLVEEVLVGEYDLVETSKASENVGYIGILSDLYADLDTSEDTNIYTDNHTHTMEIKINEEVSMPRKDCDNNPNSTCSSGLHQMSVNYGLRLGTTTLTCLTNPYNVVAIPNESNFSKFRCCAYLPIGLTEYEKNNIVEFEPGTYDIPYNGIENLVNLLQTKSLQELQESGEISSEISDNDMDIVMTTAREVIKNRMVKL